MSGLIHAGSVPDVASYDRILVFLSGGKDSIACLDAVLGVGADPNRIELHHHDCVRRERGTVITGSRGGEREEGEMCSPASRREGLGRAQAAPFPP